MSELLKDTMNERASGATTPHIDIDSIIATGDRRVRRNRAVGVGAAAAAVVAAAVFVPAMINGLGDGPRNQAAAGVGFEQRSLTWATGSAIHYGDDTLEVGRPVKTFVQTDDGFTYVSGTEVYFADGTSNQLIGATDQPYGIVLAAGDSGSYVAWLDTAADAFTVYDTGEREVVASEPTAVSSDEEFGIPTVNAVDGTTAYWFSDGESIAYDIESGEATVLADGVTNGWLIDVANGQVATQAEPESGNQIAIGADPANPSALVPGNSHITLSVDATYAATDPNDSEQVFRVSDGADVTPATPGYGFIAVVQWIDDDRYTALGLSEGDPEGQPFDLLTCSVSGGTCEVAVEDAATVAEIAFPVGADIRDD